MTEPIDNVHLFNVEDHHTMIRVTYCPDIYLNLPIKAN